MTTVRRIDPAEALDTLFQIVREEALNNPKFARRLLDAVGHTVEFRGEAALAAVDPTLVSQRMPSDEDLKTIETQAMRVQTDAYFTDRRTSIRPICS